MVQFQQLVGSQGCKRVATPFVVAKLHLVDTGSKRLDNRPHLAPGEVLIGNIDQKGYNR